VSGASTMGTTLPCTPPPQALGSRDRSFSEGGDSAWIGTACSSSDLGGSRFRGAEPARGQSWFRHFYGDRYCRQAGMLVAPRVLMIEHRYYHRNRRLQPMAQGGLLGAVLLVSPSAGGAVKWGAPGRRIYGGAVEFSCGKRPARPPVVVSGGRPSRALGASPSASASRPRPFALVTLLPPSGCCHWGCGCHFLPRVM